MPTLLDYFQNDFKDLSLDIPITFNYKKKDILTGEVKIYNLIVKQRILQQADSSTRLFTFYIPETPDIFFICKATLDDIEKWREEANKIIAIGTWGNDKTVGIHSIVYSSRIYFYTENELSEDELLELNRIATDRKLFITIRSQSYIKRKMEIEKPMAFICHDSRDKEQIAKPLATGLNSRLCYVWFDEYSLKIGDSLRETIEKGIKEAKKCVLVITPNFLNNPGWTKKEFNSIFTREMIFNERVVLPIWYNVKKEEVYDYSPSLADTVALIWPDRTGFNLDDYNKEIEKLISKVHTAITSSAAVSAVTPTKVTL